MGLEDPAVQANLESTLTSVRSLTERLKQTQARVQSLGFIARGFVEKDISGSTGRSLPEWAKAAESLSAMLAAAGNDAQARARAAQAIAAERPRLAALRAYLERAPEKVGKVPGAVLKPAQRADFLREVGDQARAIESLEQQLAELAEALASAG